ncbi:DUF551 domain-containing protein [Acinetobacter pittii]|uniref:DUF551 domain-containing protein n=1 Tax=Acinetobacter pittii TaxID=48296 RepID=UPI003BA2B785
MTDLNKEREAFETWFTTTDVYKRISHQIQMCGSGRHQDIFTVFQRDDWREENYAQVSVMAAWLAWQEKAKAQAVPVWISVEDSLPEEGEEVIVHHFGHVVQATKDKNYVGGFKQRNCYGWESVSSYISHWMPKNFKLPDTYNMYYTDENPYKETLASESGAEG